MSARSGNGLLIARLNASKLASLDSPVSHDIRISADLADKINGADPSSNQTGPFARSSVSTAGSYRETNGLRQKENHFGFVVIADLRIAQTFRRAPKQKRRETLAVLLSFSAPMLPRRAPFRVWIRSSRSSAGSPKNSLAPGVSNSANCADSARSSP